MPSPKSTSQEPEAKADPAVAESKPAPAPAPAARKTEAAPPASKTVWKLYLRDACGEFELHFATEAERDDGWRKARMMSRRGVEAIKTLNKGEFTPLQNFACWRLPNAEPV